MSSDHKLAAILFADIAGYTAMMQKNEQDALELLNRFKEVLENITPKFQGRIIQYFGDGCLLAFDSSTNSVDCAIALQKTFSEIPAVPVRIGLHLGDVIFRNENVFGDGVNIASRIESLGIPGAILISKTIRDQIKNKSDFLLVSLGTFDFKNVSEPMEIFALANPGFVVPKRDEMHGKLKDISKKNGRLKWIAAISIVIASAFAIWFFIERKTNTSLPNSIIVLPFKNISPDTSQNYFAEGITVDIIMELGKVKNLSTLATNTSLNYRNTTKTNLEISKETNVSYVLMGSIQKSDQKLRVNVQLVNPETNESIYANTFDKETKFVLDIQKDIARNVAEALSVKLSQEEKDKLSVYKTKNLQAYDLFIKARSELNTAADPEHLHNGIKLVEQALELDPHFPEALTLWAFANTDITWADELDPVDQAAKAKEAVQKSLTLNPNYAESYIVLGTINWFLEWKAQEAKKNLDKGWELSNHGHTPISACLCGNVEFELAQGKYKEALSLIDEIEKSDPFFPYLNNEKFFAYRMLYDTVSIRVLLNNATPRDQMVPYYEYELGEYGKTIVHTLNLDHNDSYYSSMSLLASAYFKLGNKEKSDSIINILIEQSAKKRNIDFNLAVVFASRSEKENAIKWFKSAYRKHDLWIYGARFTPDFRSVIDETEVRDILKNMGY